MKIPLMLLINGCKNGQDVVEECVVASTITQERKRSQGRINHFISTVRTPCFCLTRIRLLSTTFIPINFNNMTRGKMIHLKPIPYDSWRET